MVILRRRLIPLTLLLLVLSSCMASADTIWVMDLSSCRSLYRYPVTGGTSDQTFSIVGGELCTLGVAAGAGRLWVLGPFSCNSVSRTDPTTGDVNVIGLQGSNCGVEIAYGDGFLWVARDNSTIAKIDPSTGDLISSVGPVGSSGILHVAYGGGFLWVVDGSHCARVRKVNPADGTIAQSFVLSDTNCIRALTYGAGHLWVAGIAGSSTVSKVDPVTGSIVGNIVFGSGWAIRCMAYDGDAPTPPVVTISTARQASPGTEISVELAIVTASAGDRGRIESAERSSGIKLIGSPLPPRDWIVNLSGTIEMSDGEKAIRVSTFTEVDPGTVKPLGMTAKSIALYGPDTGVTHTLGTTGLCTSAMLVGTWGRVTDRGTGFFYVDDGSGVRDGTGSIGLRVLCDGLTPPAVERWVQVIGINTFFLNGSTYLPALRLRDSFDLRPLD